MNRWQYDPLSPIFLQWLFRKFSPSLDETNHTTISLVKSRINEDAPSFHTVGSSLVHLNDLLVIIVEQWNWDS